MNNVISPLRFSLAFIMMLVSASAIAGGESELRNEISFLAKKLLDQSGKNELTIVQPSVQKPFLGICGEPGHHGVLLTCVTPGHNAHKSGLQTGDMITSINGVSMLGQRSHSHDHKSENNAYMTMMNKMKTDQVLKLLLLRQGKEVNLSVKVGALNQPSYTLIIKRN